MPKTPETLEKTADLLEASSLTRTIKQISVPDGDGFAVATPFAILTVYRADQDRETNSKLTAELAQAIEQAGLASYKLHGEWPDLEGPVSEESFFVTPGDPATFKDTVKRLADQFRQPKFLMSDGHEIWIESEPPVTLGHEIDIKGIEKAYREAREQSEHNFVFARGQP